MIDIPCYRYDLKMSLRIYYITLVEARRSLRLLKPPQLSLYTCMNIYLIESEYDISYTTEPVASSDGVYISLATTDIYTSTSHVDSHTCNTNICVICDTPLFTDYTIHTCNTKKKKGKVIQIQCQHAFHQVCILKYSTPTPTGVSRGLLPAADECPVCRQIMS